MASKSINYSREKTVREKRNRKKNHDRKKLIELTVVAREKKQRPQL